MMLPMRFIPWVFALTSAIFASGVGSQAGQAEDSSPVVVELFTSQGCSSCPPAEAFLSDLAQRKDVIALEYHVDYWDYIGWKDPFADPLFTQRQRNYARQFGRRNVYTPQMVIDGSDHAVGSRRSEVNALIRDARTQHPSREVGARLEPRPDHQMGLLAVLNGRPKNGKTLDVNFVSFEDQHTTKVKHGENAGRELTNSRVVRRLERLGQWRGGMAEIAIDPSLMIGDGSVLLLQEPNGGPIVAADIWR